MDVTWKHLEEAEELINYSTLQHWAIDTRNKYVMPNGTVQGKETYVFNPGPWSQLLTYVAKQFVIGLLEEV